MSGLSGRIFQSSRRRFAENEGIAGGCSYKESRFVILTNHFWGRKPMRCRFLAVVLVSMLVSGCQGPGLNNGFYQSPHRVPGVDGPGPGVIGSNMGQNAKGGILPEHYQNVSMTSRDMMSPPGHISMPPMFIPTSQINFLGVESLVIRYDAQEPGAFDSAPLVCPATHDFGQGAIYRLKLSNIPGHPGKELYPTLEIAPTAARTQAFLAHNSVPVEFNDNDFDQVFSGNFVTKVVYLPNPEFQGIAMSGAGTLVNTQLQPGADPIIEASKRGSILAVIRMGNKDLSNRPHPAQWAGSGSFAPNNPNRLGMPSSIPQNPIAGVNIPHYGVPMTKTTTGVPGPPQLPHDVNYGPNRHPVVRTEPIPAPPAQRTYAMPGQPIGNPYAPPGTQSDMQPGQELPPQPQAAR